MRTKQWRKLRDALEAGDSSRAASLIEQEPELLHERNGIGETVLHFLAVENNATPVEWLFQHGADLNTTNEFGTPVLFEVAALGYRDLLVWLVKNGANLKAKSSDGLSLIEYLGDFGKTEMIRFLYGSFPELEVR